MSLAPTAEGQLASNLQYKGPSNRCTLLHIEHFPVIRLCKPLKSEKSYILFLFEDLQSFAAERRSNYDLKEYFCKLFRRRFINFTV